MSYREERTAEDLLMMGNACDDVVDGRVRENGGRELQSVKYYGLGSGIIRREENSQQAQEGSTGVRTNSNLRWFRRNENGKMVWYVEGMPRDILWRLPSQTNPLEVRKALDPWYYLKELIIKLMVFRELFTNL